MAKITKNKAPKLTWKSMEDVFAQILAGEPVYVPGAPKTTEKVLEDFAYVFNLFKETKEKLEDENAELKLANDRLTKKIAEVVGRNGVLVSDARKIAADGLIAQAHAVSANARVLIITTPNVTLLDHATTANLTNRLQRVCKNLDAILMVKADLDIQALDLEDAAEKHNIVPIPERKRWTDNRESELKKLGSLFDKYSR